MALRPAWRSLPAGASPPVRGEATLAALLILPPATVITEMANMGASSPHTSATGPKEAAPSPKGVTEGLALAIGVGTSTA